MNLAAAGMAAASLGGAPAKSAPVVPPPYKHTDVSKGKNVYEVGYAHLDTQWRWTYLETIGEYLPKTMSVNFDFFEKYPDYVFNFTGANRYRMMKEYYPADYSKLKSYVAKGRWYPDGSSWEENDVNTPSPESIVRQMLYGNQFYKKEFGFTPIDFILPDCFGFPASLPTILAHCGVKGFSTQKLTWGYPNPIPFTVGNWIGTDGKSVIAALDPGSYSGRVTEDLSLSDSLLSRINMIGEKSGAYVDYRYYGTGDTGGGPTEDSVKWIEQAINGSGPVHVISAPADQIFKDMTPKQVSKLPTYKGDLELTNHSAGSITSQAYLKRWNRKNELLADAAERASVAADWLGGMPYPKDKLTEAWHLILGAQFHDIIPGTSVPKAYEYSWNDEVVALNHSASALQGAVGAVTRGMDTRATGVPVIVYNPLSTAREDVVDATVRFPGAAPTSVRVYGPDGSEVPSQVRGRSAGGLEILFLAKAPAVGFAAFDVRPSATPSRLTTGLRVSKSTLENTRYRVTLNGNGDVAQILDKAAKRNLLSAPARLAFKFDEPAQWPAWNMDWDQQSAPPTGYVSGPAGIRVVENGPVRVAIEVTRTSQGSKFVQRIRLAAAGAGNRVEFDNDIDWNTRQHNLKATFPLAVSSKVATYNLGMGTIKRAINDSGRFEMVHRQWVDLTAGKGDYGVSMLEDSKFASDMPDDHTLRLTIVRTPGARSYQDQATQDIGHHQVLYALQGHQGDWRKGGTQWEAARLNQPLMAFQAPRHPGTLGKAFSLFHTSTSQVAISAIKQAENGRDVVVRLEELTGAPANVTLSAARPILAAHEVDGEERSIGKATLKGGTLVVKMGAYSPRAFALTLGKPAVRMGAPLSQPVALPFNFAASTTDGRSTTAGFDGKGHTIAADLMPPSLVSEGIAFKLRPTGKNAVSCNGQNIRLPRTGNGSGSVYILAAATGGDQTGTFAVDGRRFPLRVQDWSGFVGQWDNRIWKQSDVPGAPRLDGGIYGLKPAYIKRGTIAWVGRHRHTADGKNDIYAYSYIFKYRLPATGAKALTLPRNANIRVFAVTVANNPNDDTAPAQYLYDHFQQPVAPPSFSPAGRSSSDSITVSLAPSLYVLDATYHYTTDGSVPTAKSPAYSTPLLLSKSAIVSVRPYFADGTAGPVSKASYTVNDTTSPEVKNVLGIPGSPLIRVTFSEPIEKSTASASTSFSFTGGLTVQSARPSADGRAVDLTVEPAPTAGQAYSLTTTGLKDRSPAGNSVASTAVDFAPAVPGVQFTASPDGAPVITGPVSPVEATVVGTPKPADGPLGTPALLFSGTADGLTVPNAPEMNPTSAITVAAWVNANGWEGNRPIVQKGGRNNQYRLYANGQITWDIGGVGTVQAPLPSTGQWHLLAATYDGAMMELYIDGKLVASQDAFGSIPTSVDPLSISSRAFGRAGGGAPQGNRPRPAPTGFDGKISNVSIYNVALLPAHIRDLARTQ